MSALFWGLALLALVLGLSGNFYFSDKSLLLRIIGMLIAVTVALGLASLTTQGKTFVQFAKDSRNELRKIVWPSRQETMQMTGIVIAMVTIVGLVLWGIDAILLRLIGWVSGYYGT